MGVSKNLADKVWLFALGLVMLGVVFRLLPHEANFAPVAAIALLSGALLGRKYALLVPIGILLVSDAILGTYSSISFTWVAFLMIGLYGSLFRRSGFRKRVLLGGLGSTLIFFIVSNFGVWVASGMYPPTLAGLANCYYLALPFLRATLLSDLIYSGLLFGIVAWLAQPKIKLASHQPIAS